MLGFCSGSFRSLALNLGTEEAMVHTYMISEAQDAPILDKVPFTLANEGPSQFEVLHCKRSLCSSGPILYASPR